MDEASTVRAIFDQLASRGYEPRLRGFTGTCRFDIENAGRWYLTVEAGRISLSEHPGHVDWTVGCSAADLIQIMEGRQNPITAWLQGRVSVTGDVATALGFARAYPLVR